MIRKLAWPVACAAMIGILMVYSKSAIVSGLSGIRLWLDIIFPSLFPFMVVSNMLNRSGIIPALGVLLHPVMKPLFNVPGQGALPLLLGITSGYPMGARVTADLKLSGHINTNESERLLAFTNNSGPLFILGAVGAGLFHSAHAGLLLLACHILGGITVGILFRFYGRNHEGNSNPCHEEDGFSFHKFTVALRDIKPPVNFGQNFSDAISSSMSLIFIIGGFIIFFSVLIGLLLEIGLMDWASKFLGIFTGPMGIGPGVIKAILCGFFEISTGTSLITMTSDGMIPVKLTAASAIIGWAGLSVHAQVMSIAHDAAIRIKPYLFGKMLHGIIAASYTFACIKLFPRVIPEVINEASTVFNPFDGIKNCWPMYLEFGLKLVSIFIIILFLAYYLRNKKR